jgi:serine/threonine protein kinase
LADADDRSRHPKTGASHKRVGSVVRGKYRVEAFLATGTMGNVYAATHRNGARVALKILHKQLAEDPALCERFKREGYFANSIGHPGIVRAIDDDVTEDGCPFLVMELLEGETIDERRRRKGGKLPLSWLLPVADSLLDILAAAHKHNVVHRDLKPDNVFVTKAGEVKVLDFGVARWNDGKSSSDMTGVGMVLGTPAYMPPEQALGRREDVDAQSDLWAVGATLFVALSGESVHVGGDAKAKLIATARTAARPIREAAPEVPRAVAQVIDRALAFHKQERWPDAEAMREAMRWARMTLDDRPSQQVAASSEQELEKIPVPVPTRRTVDDEPTVMRVHRALAEDAPQSAPQSKDFLTSAPPITMRDLPKSVGPAPSSMGPVFSLANDPVFSLRRGKDDSPSTERVPKAEATSDTAILIAHASDRVVHADAMPSYDPADAMSDAMGEDMPFSSQGHGPKSVDVNFSFTRPMAAMVMPPGYESPRPAAGMREPQHDPHSSSPPRVVSGPPPHLRTAPGIGPAQPPQPAPAQGQYSSAPPGVHASAGGSTPADAYAQMTTGPSMRPGAEGFTRPSLPPESPGPLLSQIVKPRLSAAKVILPIAFVLVASIAAFVVLRTRAANAQHASAAMAATPAAPATGTAAGSAAPGASGAANAANAANAPPAIATANVANLPDADPKSAKAATAEPKKRPRLRPRKPPAVKPAAEPATAPDPATAATATAEPTATAAATATAAPPDLTPKDSLPAKDPDPPKPAPAPPADTAAP